MFWSLRYENILLQKLSLGICFSTIIWWKSSSWVPYFSTFFSFEIASKTKNSAEPIRKHFQKVEFLPQISEKLRVTNDSFNHRISSDSKPQIRFELSLFVLKRGQVIRFWKVWNGRIYRQVRKLWEWTFNMVSRVYSFDRKEMALCTLLVAYCRKLPLVTATCKRWCLKEVTRCQ